MLCISKKTQYALAALGHLAEQPGRVASAREIAAAHALPTALIINILKNLQGHGLLRSTRGVKGGYQVARDLAEFSLHDLIAIVECEGHSADGDCGCLEQAQDVTGHLGHLARNRPTSPHGPVQALQFKLVRFLREVRVADLVLPGRRIDVPVERLTFKDNTRVVN